VKFWCSAALWCVLLPAPVWAGTVAVAAPRVESDRVEVPIVLHGGGDGVTTMDFQLRYDPAVFVPVQIAPGASTVAAGKVVEAHNPEPGAYNVLVMGVNRHALPDGEVARVVLRRLDDAAGQSALRVERPTLANAAGQVLDSQGGQHVVRLDGGEKPGDGPVEQPVSETPAEQPVVEPPARDDGLNPVAPGEVLEDKDGIPLAQRVADAMLAGLEEHRRPAGRPSDPADPSPRVSGEETPQPRYSIQERRLPVTIDMSAVPEGGSAEPASRMQVAQAPAPGGETPPARADAARDLNDSIDPAAAIVAQGSADGAGAPAHITVEPDAMDPVAEQAGATQGVRWELILVFVPVVVLAGYGWRKRRAARS
jgi:hypothetical protein